MDRQKRTVLVDFVATLARVLTRRGNRIGALVDGGGTPRTVPVASGRVAVLRLVDGLLAEPALDAAPATDLTALLERAVRTIKRRSLIVIVSDFISQPGWERPLHLLNQRNELLAVRLVDPRERELPDVGLVLVRDAETGEQLEIDTGDAAFRKRFAAAAAGARGRDRPRLRAGRRGGRSRSRRTRTSWAPSCAWRRGVDGGGPCA